MRADGAPAGVTLIAPAGRDALIASFGRAFHADTGLPLGASRGKQPPLAALPAVPAAGETAVAVVGAHLSGMPLNGELTALGARLLQSTATASDYRLYALAGGPPAKPGLLRVAEGQGTAVEVEIWAMQPGAFGRLVAAVPPPLTIGTVRLADGRTVKGFLVEFEAVRGARDISSFGGWRGFVATAKAPAA
jgi:allophanate hydrolase